MKNDGLYTREFHKVRWQNMRVFYILPPRCPLSSAFAMTFPPPFHGCLHLSNFKPVLPNKFHANQANSY